MFAWACSLILHTSDLQCIKVHRVLCIKLSHKRCWLLRMLRSTSTIVLKQSFPVVHADTIYPITGHVFFWNNSSDPPSTMKFCTEIDLEVIWVVQHVQETASFFKLWNAERMAKKVIGKMHLDFYQLCQTIQTQPI